MATKVVMEALSPTMEEGRLVEWKKQEGEAVTAGDVLAEVETDKAVMELVARAGGTLLKHVVPAGATVPVSQTVAVIGEPGEDVSSVVGGAAASDKQNLTAVGDKAAGGETDGADQKTAKPAAETEAPRRPAAPRAPLATGAPGRPAPASTSAPAAAAPGADAPRADAAPTPTTAPAPPNGDRIKASPLARRIAAERGVDLRAIAGSGPQGRIVQRDLASAPAGARDAPPSAVAPAEGFEDRPLTQIRKTIAKRLVQSIGPIPTFYLTSEVDMERTASARAALPDKISFNDIVIKAVALALRRHPACNAWWQDDHVRVWHEVHVGMAVAIDDGLITPVIRHADRKSLRQIAAESGDLAERARARRVTPEEYSGATFSVSNLGMLDIDEFTAIINPPEAGILAVGRIVEKPVVTDGRVEVRHRMRMTMSCDHRVIDGATGAKFLKTLKTMLENPLAML